GAHRLPHTEEGEHDGEPHCRLRRRDRDDEEREELPAVVLRPKAVVGDEGQVHRVEHELDAHEQDEQVPPEEKAHRARDEEDRGDGEEVLDRDRGHDALSLAWACAFGSGAAASASGFFSSFAGSSVGSTCLPRATATAPTTATRRSAPLSSNGTSWMVKSSR